MKKDNKTETINKNFKKNHKLDFPLLKKTVYLDNAATTQKPTRVIERIKKFYEQENANTHSGEYYLSEHASVLLEDARKEFADLINAKQEEIVFTRNATDSFNLIAELLKPNLSKKDNIVISTLEHHSNFVPWQQIASQNKIELRVAKYDDKNEQISPQKLVDKNTKIVSFTLMSNVTGLITNAEKIIRDIRKKNKDTIIILDVTQAVSHIFVDIKKLGADFACFSAHKLYGPAGVGIMYGRKEILDILEPQRFGGNMIHSVTKQKSTWVETPHKFESGTNNAEGIIGAGEAIKYLKREKLELLFKKEEELKKYALSELGKIKQVKIIGHKKEKYGPLISFTIQNLHPHDVATICERHNVCVRAGQHCAEPLHEALGVIATTRISISFYNDKKDIDTFIIALKDTIKILSVKNR
ncbi:MAG: aminotransferase class V-fold PLP-dependent enzyme [Candidatus Nanoarchaeia archaeon]